MHLRSLTMQALGPFAGKYTIDFEQLGASGLYLLEGPTGAGKSTIIDAIVFALYGKVASADSSDDRLRSGYADEDTETYVDLVFETGSGEYRVLRSPEWMRAKKRGSGTTKQQATVKLWRLAGPDGALGAGTADPAGGELISTRLDEAGAEIQRAIGLDRAQFVQTIVLPQGEFASFLRADPEHRRGLLQKVFGTAVYERVQDRLVAMRIEVQRAVAAARTDVGAAVAHFVGSAGITDEVPGPVGAAGPGELASAAELRALGEVASPDVLPAVRAHVDALAQAAADATRAEAAARDELTRARSVFDETRVLADAVARRAALRAEQDLLAERAPTHAADVERRDLARRASVVAPVLTAAGVADAAAGRARDRLARARSVVPADLARLDRAGLTAARDGFAAQVATLARVERLERDLPDRRRHLDADETTLVSAVAEQEALAVEAVSRPAARNELVSAITACQEVAADLPVRQQRAEAARTAGEAARTAETLAVTLAAAIAAAADRLALAQEAIAAEAYLRGRRLAGMAGELAAGLAPDAPCPVCGAREHPQVAALAADHATAEQVELAEGARTVAEAAFARASGIVTTLTERLSGQRELAGPKTLAEHDADAEQLGVLVAMAVTARSELDVLHAALADHDAATEEAAVRSRALDTAITTARVSVAALRSDLTSTEREIEMARDGRPTVAARVADLGAQVAACDALAAALEGAERAEQDLSTRSTELAAALAAQGFADGASARAALLPAADLTALEAAIAAQDAALARVSSGLAEPAIAALADDVVVDLEAARVAQAGAEAVAGAAAGAAVLAARSASSAAAAMDEVEAALALHEAARALAGPVTRMADLAAASGGDNAKRLTLATYVLVKRFEDVVAAANDRLLPMSDGRFELVRSDEREDVRSRRTGLSMKVIDHRMEAARDPRTLSGGETFYVSLCLALGMADVVTAEAGGIELGTLFVDEGFGSLDPETLEAVLVELGKLRAGGRVVGVVSHVEALKQSIAERIEVRRLADGSSTLTVRAG
ncbi:AAA family ATPase [Pengzhenrongella frigida]|uniref:Nuclease SbcCD subunit C n=1 Tax=Pengzhenrongella frigida TaxID=1259133 RepID=A0A4Q5N6I6_9MICO|nr:SMC family ATPase [Cellulomonas sp. HLT2-17]RYV51871.1 SMC family ATPase [Cellulomonas sp. HLT2-17]